MCLPQASEALRQVFLRSASEKFNVLKAKGILQIAQGLVKSQ
jgi:hypothetical protein